MKLVNSEGNRVGKQNLLELFANRLYGSDASTNWMQKNVPQWTPDVYAAVKAGADNPLSFKTNKIDVGDGNFAEFKNAGTTGRLLWENMKAHPFKSAGLGAAGLMNIGGLFDNDQLIGQAAGLGLGGLAAAKVLPALGVGGIANGALAVMGGGALGSLFDKLMAKKKEEEAVMQEAYSNAGVY